MNAKILDGKALAAEILLQVKSAMSTLPSETISPKLVIVQVLGDEASDIYVKHKLKAIAEVGMQAFHFAIPSNVSQQQMLSHILQLNADPGVHGILLQLPLPAHLDAEALLAVLDPKKDVDGLTPLNLGLLMRKTPQFTPCTPAGIVQLLIHNEIPLRGKEVVILNASALVGRPLAMLLLDHGATVTICNSKTEDLKKQLQRADILVSATGKQAVVPGEWIKQDAVVVDVGIHRSAEGLRGDIDATSAMQRAGWITPVPGGVGPMTVAMLVQNLWQAYLACCANV